MEDTIFNRKILASVITSVLPYIRKQKTLENSVYWKEKLVNALMVRTDVIYVFTNCFVHKVSLSLCVFMSMFHVQQVIGFKYVFSGNGCFLFFVVKAPFF